jgi:hypothetical protein
MTTGELTFSVIVNTMDRAGPLRTLLQTLEGQSYPHFEVIAVVGPGSDATLAMLAAYGERVKVLRCPDANLSRSRNIGLLAARGDIVAYVDDDAAPCRRWLEQLTRLFAADGLDGAGGTVYMIYPQAATIQHRLGVASSLAENVNVRGSASERLPYPGRGRQWTPRMMGTDMAFRRKSLLAAGGFDQFFVYIAEETDLALRLANAGQTLQPVREAVVYHVPASSLNRTIFTQRGRWWWLETRSATYLCLKDGPAGGDRPAAILRRCLELVHGHWLAYSRFWRGGELGLGQALGMAALELRGAAEGVAGGLFRGRQTIPPATAQAAGAAAEPIRPFQNAQSPLAGAVDPITGRQPVITVAEPPLRICLLSHSYPPASFDGVGRLTNLMARGLFELGHTVHVVTGGDREGVSFYDGAYVHRIPYRLERYERYAAFSNLHHALNLSHAIYEQVRRLALNDGVQIVDSPLWLFEGLVTAVSSTIPVVVRLVTALKQVAAIHGDHSDDARLVGEMERLLMERAAHLLPNTRATLDAVRTAYGLAIPEERYTVVPYGIPPAAEEAIRPFDPARPPAQPMLLFVGRLEKRKGILDLFEAIPRVLRHTPNVRFIIAGADNSQHDGFYRQTGMDYPTYFGQRYRAYAGQVRFTGRVDDATLDDLYRSCDLLVAPSRYESFGLIYLEAMNYAKPVIGCRAGGVPEVIDHGVTGLLADPEAPASLAEAIVSLLAAPARLREFGLAGRSQILQRFTHVHMAQAFAAAYRAVLRSIPPCPAP